MVESIILFVFNTKLHVEIQIPCTFLIRTQSILSDWILIQTWKDHGTADTNHFRSKTIWNRSQRENQLKKFMLGAKQFLFNLQLKHSVASLKVYKRNTPINILLRPEMNCWKKFEIEIHFLYTICVIEIRIICIKTRFNCAKQEAERSQCI